MNMFLNRIFVQLKKNYCLTAAQTKLREMLSKVVGKGDVSENSKIITIQCLEDYYFFSLFCALATTLKTQGNVSFEQYVVRSLNVGSSQSIANWLKSYLLSNRLTDKKWISLYSLFCNKIAFRATSPLGYISDIKLLFISVKIWRNLSSKSDVLKLSWQDVLLGDLIYDSYLRFKPAPTVHIRNFYMLTVIWQALRTFKSAKRYFSKTKPSAYFTSYTTYIQHGIPVRVALYLGIPVYSFSNFQTVAKRLKLDDTKQTASCNTYFSDFQSLDDKDSKLLAAEKQLQFRIDGGIDTATAYMAKSAYHANVHTIPNVTNAAVIFLHDFYDSPHIYSWSLFPDFYDWICFTIETLTKSKIPFFIKPHPNQIDLSSEVISQLQAQYPGLRWLPITATNKRLVDAGITCAITVYGTVAHEMAFLGIPVITCGDNPHISFDFCKNATTHEEYQAYLVSADKLQFDAHQMRAQSLMFYYMHNMHRDPSESLVMNVTQKLFKLSQTVESGEEDTSHLFDTIVGLMEMSEFKTLCSERFGRHLV
jgi:hypothetical protein